MHRMRPEPSPTRNISTPDTTKDLSGGRAWSPGPDAHALLEMALERKASDLHISVGIPPMIRVDGELRPLDEALPPITVEAAERLARSLMSEARYGDFMANGEVDFSYGVRTLGRFRVNAYRQRGSVALAVRLIPSNVPSFEELGLPETVRALASRQAGLVLVAGPTGSGKTTTLAAMVDYINNTFNKHVITIEDPIEYLHSHKKSMVSQRELATDTVSFARAIRAALRQDPNVIVIGDMRDLETIDMAMLAAETGHLVLASFNAANAVQAVDRIVEIFPPRRQQQVRIRLSCVLEGVIAQRLLRRADGTGKAAAVEVLVANSVVRNLIREAKSHQLYNAMVVGGRFGMQSLESSLYSLFKAEAITLEQARSEARDQDEFKRLMETDEENWLFDGLKDG